MLNVTSETGDIQSRLYVSPKEWTRFSGCGQAEWGGAVSSKGGREVQVGSSLLRPGRGSQRPEWEALGGKVSPKPCLRKILSGLPWRSPPQNKGKAHHYVSDAEHVKPVSNCQRERAPLIPILCEGVTNWGASDGKLKGCSHTKEHQDHLRTQAGEVIGA